MNFSQSLLAFDDLRPHFDRALGSERGIKITCDSYSQAVILRARFNYYRKLDRQSNKRTYGEEHPLHNRSIYDRLILRVPKKGTADENCVFLEKRSPEAWKIEEIKP
jgi:hypothetical protein